MRPIRRIASADFLMVLVTALFFGGCGESTTSPPVSQETAKVSPEQELAALTKKAETEEAVRWGAKNEISYEEATAATRIDQNLAGAFLVPPVAHASSLELCKSIADTTRAMGPIRKDSVTVGKNVVCVPGKLKNRFVYMLEVSGVSQDILKQIDVSKDIKPGSLNQFCTDPHMRALLNAFDIDHRYYTERGVFVGSFLMESRECERR